MKANPTFSQTQKQLIQLLGQDTVNKAIYKSQVNSSSLTTKQRPKLAVFIPPHTFNAEECYSIATSTTGLVSFSDLGLPPPSSSEEVDTGLNGSSSMFSSISSLFSPSK